MFVNFGNSVLHNITDCKSMVADEEVWILKSVGQDGST